MTPRFRDALAFGLTFLPVFLVLFWLYPRILPAYERAVLHLVNPWLGAGTPPLFVEAQRDGALEVYVGAATERQPLTTGPYRPDAVFVSLALLPALLLATPVRLAVRARLMLLAVPLLYAVHVVVLVALLRAKLCLALEPEHLTCTWTLVLTLTSGQTGAVALWALLSWRHWLPAGAIASMATAPEPERNRPCPCGSGRKYKRCCAR